MACSVCSEVSANAYSINEMMFGWRHPFQYNHCLKCGCLELAAVPDDQHVYYPKNYAPLSTLRWPREAIKAVENAKIETTARILDVGCGNGSALLAFDKLGYLNLTGIDPYLTQDITFASGLSLRKATIEDLTGKWDVIMFHHSLEHLPDHHQVINHCIRLLNPNGICLIRTPIMGTYAWQHYGVHWVQLDAPRHILIHSISSLSILAMQHSFQITSILFDSDEFQFWGSEQYMRGIALNDSNSFAVDRENSSFTPSQIRSFKIQASILNKKEQGDQATIVLKMDG